MEIKNSNNKNKQTGSKKRINDEFNVHLPHAKLFRRNVIIFKSHTRKREYEKNKKPTTIYI